MIIETPYKNGDTVSIKLMSGEEVVARLDEETATGVKVKHPMMLVANQQGVGLGPFMFTVNGDATFNLKNTSILCIAKTEKEMASQYIQTTTGLAVI